MAKLYGEIAAKALLTLDKSFARANGQPLDASEVYYSLQAAKDYATTAQAYIGQKIVVIENGIVSHYSVEDTAGTLKELGSKPVADGTTVAIDEATGKITLANITETEKTGTYNAVLVNGALTWVKPSSTTVEGLSDLITALTGRVEALETAVGKAAEGEAAATGLFKAIADEVARATDAEEALGERIDGISIPVEGVAADDKVLSLTDKLISATVSLGYDEDSHAIKLYGKDNAELGSVDATPFIKDGMLDDVSYDADTNTLTFTWNTASGEKSDTVVLSDIIEPYTAGVGLELVGNEFKAKLAEGSESYLTITADGIKLAGIADAIATAKQEAINDAAGKYATTETVNGIAGRVEVLEGHDHSSYATKEELAPVAQDAANAKTAVGNLETRFDEIVAVGGEPNAINKIQVNGSELTITDKTVNITVPTKASDLTDDTGFDARITAAQNQADKAVDDAAAAASAASAAQTDVNALEPVVGEHTTKISNLETTVGGHTTKIANLENADTQHKAEYESLQEIVNGHTEQIAAKAEATVVSGLSQRVTTAETNITTITETTIPAINENIGKKANSTDVYTKSEIDAITGEVAEGKTIVDLINDAKTESTYDDTAIKALIQGNTDAITILNGDASTAGSVISIANAQAKAEVAAIVGAAPETMDTLEEVANWIANDQTGAAAMAADIAANKSAIAAINNEETGILATAEAYADALFTGIPAATAEKLGLVKVDNVSIKVDETGTIGVKAVSTDLLTQGT